jgi:hypothetical protein
VIQDTLNQLHSPQIPVDFQRLRAILQEAVCELLNATVDFTQTLQGRAINQHDINQSMGFDSQTTTPKEYIEALFGYCAPNLFDTNIESPFNTLIDAERWSIATQFLLGITNIYLISKEKISPNFNLGQFLDAEPKSSTQLAEKLARAQQNKESIEEACLSWINAYAPELELTAFITEAERKTIKETFAVLYAAIKDSPHFDEFFILAPKGKGILSSTKGLSVLISPSLHAPIYLL